MLGFRERRQLLAAAVIAVFIGGLGFLFVRSVLPQPTCFDHLRNQGEEEVDCGGPCQPCAVKQAGDIEVLWVRPVQSRQSLYDVAALIRNPNANLAAASLEYEFELFDERGIGVASRRGKSFLFSGESAHIVEVGLATGRQVLKAVISLNNVSWALPDQPRPDIVAGSREYAIEESEGRRQSVLKAVISNRGLADVSDVMVSAAVFDERGNLLGAHRTIIDELPAGEARPVKFVWPEALGGAVSSFVIEARSPAGLTESQP